MFRVVIHSKHTLCIGIHHLQLHTFFAVAEKIRAKLVELKKAHPDDSAGVTTCFQTMQKYLANVYRDPSQEKFRNIRVGNPAFQQRVGMFKGSLDILELCGFKVRSRPFLADRTTKCVVKGSSCVHPLSGLCKLFHKHPCLHFVETLTINDHQNFDHQNFDHQNFACASPAVCRGVLMARV